MNTCSSPLYRLSTMSLVMLTFCAGCDSAAQLEQSPVSGTWRAACYLSTDLPQGLEDEYSTSVVTFAGGQTGLVSGVTHYHSTADCSDPADINYSATSSGRYVLGETFTSAEGQIVQELDVLIDTREWLDGQKASYREPERTLDIVYIQGNQLYLGVDPDDGMRATQLDFNIPFVWQSSD